MQVVARGDEWEVLNTAVKEDRQGEGIGRRILDVAIDAFVAATGYPDPVMSSPLRTRHM